MQRQVISARLSPSVIRGLDLMAAERGMPRSTLIAEAVKALVEGRVTVPSAAEIAARDNQDALRRRLAELTAPVRQLRG